MRLLPLLILSILIGSFAPAKAQFYQTTNAEITFFSSAPVEDIEAVSNDGVSVLNIDNGAISFKVKLRSFKFEKALMQEHFNENYMESEKFPDAIFKGQISGGFDSRSSNSQELIIKGDLTIHGVTREREIPVVIQISKDGEQLRLNSKFEVACKDHKIRIPKLLWENIAEVIEVTVNANYQIIKP
ncbi:YceI family protein [Christiangramia sabulilitoris]|uniref:YceI family protein n=1 Tax=Christiangramia sabulilitoris TaxID=2583991 RepID=A0A550I030_9FLAO|nr:YceI family protein [Christiangramia sabulilitoris]TRO64343.1 YceI family protein [Christiangramia sabulilitoris]